MKDIWNERYRQPEYAYGTSPNVFLAEQLAKLPKGHILLPAEGEGRNAVYAASIGWKVTAFDFSKEGRKKALTLAGKLGVTIDYIISDAAYFSTDRQFDVVALIFNHFHKDLRRLLFTKYVDLLKPQGTLIMEAFSENQLGRASGGPKENELLYTVHEMPSLFPKVDLRYCKEELVMLDEGPYHQGEASVIRIVGQKKK